MNKTATGVFSRDAPHQDEIRLWRDAALGAHGVELVAGRCLEHRYRPHFHDEFVVAVFVRGAQKYQVGRHAGVAYPGTALIIPRGETHSAASASKDGWSFRAFYPDHETLTELSQELFVGRRDRTFEFDLLPCREDTDLVRCLCAYHQIIELETDSLARQQAFASAMAMLMSRCARPRCGSRSTGREPQAIRRAMDLANTVFSDSKLSIRALSDAAGLSVYHFMRCFHATTGLTAHQYVVQLRLREARYLLATGTPACEVALAVGFADQSHFNRHFRTAFGLTPGQYAKGTHRRKGVGLVANT